MAMSPASLMAAASVEANCSCMFAIDVGEFKAKGCGEQYVMHSCSFHCSFHQPYHCPHLPAQPGPEHRAHDGGSHTGAHTDVRCC